MIGIYLLGVMALWVIAAFFITLFAFRRMPRKYWRLPLAIVLFLVLVPLPLIDEIVGGRQFEQLCKENSTIQVNRATAVGRTVYLAQTPSVKIKGTWVRVTLQPWRYVDATTGEVVVSYNTLGARGGRFLKISEGHVPLTFNGYCAPGGSRIYADRLFKELRITQVQRSELNIGESK